MDWAETAERAKVECAAARAAEAMAAAMEEEETYATVAGGGTGDEDISAMAARWVRHDDAWAAFERRALAKKKKNDENNDKNNDDGDDGGGGDLIRVSDVPWPPVSRELLPSLAAHELLEIRRRARRHESEAHEKARGDGGETGSPRLCANSRQRWRASHEHDGEEGVAAAARMTAYKRAFKKASLRWHPDKFEGRFGALLSDDVVTATSGMESEAMEEAGETHAAAIRRRVRVIAQQVNDAWSAVSS